MTIGIVYNFSFGIFTLQLAQDLLLPLYNKENSISVVLFSLTCHLCFSITLLRSYSFDGSVDATVSQTF